MLIFKSKEKVPVFPNETSFLANDFEVVSFNMSILTDESKNVASDFYVIPQNKNIEINFQFGDLGIEAYFYFDNDLEADVIFVITWEELTLRAKEVLGLDVNDQEAYDNWIESDWNDHVYYSFKEYIFNKIAAA